MLLNFKDLCIKYKMDVRGVLHIGAHHGQEYQTYKEHNIKYGLFFEPLPHVFEILKKNIGNEPNVRLVNKALGNENKTIQMHVERENESQSSSILKPKKHLTQYPHITFNETIEVEMMKLDTYLGDRAIITNLNLINIDVQGYELEVFKGAWNALEYIDYIITEVNRDELYENCAHIEEIDDFLWIFGFERMETTWDGGTWGDAFYMKTNKI